MNRKPDYVKWGSELSTFMYDAEVDFTDSYGPRLHVVTPGVFDYLLEELHGAEIRLGFVYFLRGTEAEMWPYAACFGCVREWM